MERRQFLATGAALAAGTALPALTAGAARATPGARPADRLPPRAEIVAVLRRVADHWIGAHSDPGDNQWARATFFSGLMALHRLTREPRYLAYARGWAEKHAYGLHNGVTTRHADDHCAGQTYLDLHALDATPDPAKIAAIEDSLQRMVRTSAEKHDDWWWDDALHMAMPPFARLGALRQDPAYWDAMHALYTHTKTRGRRAGPVRPRRRALVSRQAVPARWYRLAQRTAGPLVARQRLGRRCPCQGARGPAGLALARPGISRRTRR